MRRDGNRLLDYRPTGVDPARRVGNRWLLVYFLVYVPANVVAAFFSPDDLIFPMMRFFVLVAPTFSMACAVGLQFLWKPRPFHPLALIGFVIGLLAAAAWSLMFMTWVGNSMS